MSEQSTIEAIKTQLEAKHQQTQALFEEQRKSIAENGQVCSDITKQLAEVAESCKAQAAQLFDLEQKSAHKPEANKTDEPLSSLVAKKALPDGKEWSRQKTRVEVKTFQQKFLGQESGNGGGSNLLVPQRLNGIIIPGLRRLTIRQLMDQASLNGTNSIQYVKETGYTNNAAVVREGELKPFSDITFGLETATAVTIAHLMRTSRQIMGNSSMLEGYLSTRMEYGLALKEEDGLLNGKGGSTELLGINEVASAYDVSLNIDSDTDADVVAHAMYQVQLTQLEATAVIMHPLDWHRIALLKDKNGLYIFGGPQAWASNIIWGIPVVPTVSQARGTFTVGAFHSASQVWDNMSATVEFFEQDVDNVERNMVTVRCEESLAVAHYRPEALVKGVLPSFGK